MFGIKHTRPVNQLLTRLMVEYAQDQTEFAVPFVYPFVQTEGRTGTYFLDDAQNSFGFDNPEWGSNVHANDVNFRLGSQTFTVFRRAFRTPVTNDDAKNFIGPFALERFVSRKLMDRGLVAQEVRGEAVLRTSSGIQSQAAGTNWGTSGLDPIKNLRDLDDKIIKAVGRRVNTILIPPGLWSARFQTVAANTVGALMRTHLGSSMLMTQNNITPILVANWFGVQTCIVPNCVKAGSRNLALDTGGLGSAAASTAGSFIWGDTTVMYAMYRDPNPSVGSTGYGVSFGYQDWQMDEPHFDWQIDGFWYRASSVRGEIEAVAKAGGKITGC